MMKSYVAMGREKSRFPSGTKDHSKIIWLIFLSKEVCTYLGNLDGASAGTEFILQVVTIPLAPSILLGTYASSFTFKWETSLGSSATPCMVKYESDPTRLNGKFC